MLLLRCIRERNGFLRILCRSFCMDSEARAQQLKLLDKKLSKMKNPHGIYQYLKIHGAEHLYKNIPFSHLETRERDRYILINPLIARKISQALKLYLKNRAVLESDPGFGLLSREMIHYVSNLKLYEEDIHFRSDLRDFQRKYPNKIDIYDSSLRKVHGIQTDDNLDNGVRMNLLFDDIPSDEAVSMIIITPSKRFIADWIRHLLYKHYFSKFTKLEFYLFIPPSVYTRLTATPQNDYSPRYQQISVLSQLLFDIELLLNDIPRKAFLPWPYRQKKPIKRDVERYENDYEYMYLVRMSLQPEYLKHLQDEDFYRCFVAFVRETVLGKKRMVPYFEALLPGSGAKIILRGYDVYSVFRELSPVEMFSLFLDFSRWPEFRSTTFYTYWTDASLKDQVGEISVPASLVTLHDDHEDEICDEDDDDTFIPGSKVK